MKTHTSILLLVLFCTCTLQAQRFHHGLGVNYDSYRGNYGNSDAISLMYNPKIMFHGQNGPLTFGFAAPLNVSVVNSSARTRSQLVELPLVFELGFMPSGSSMPYKGCGVFVGAGVSRVLQINKEVNGMTYFNSYVGFRISPFGQPLEARLNYGSNIYLPGAYKKISIGLSYILR